MDLHFHYTGSGGIIEIVINLGTLIVAAYALWYAKKAFKQTNALYKDNKIFELKNRNRDYFYKELEDINRELRNTTKVHPDKNLLIHNYKLKIDENGKELKELVIERYRLFNKVLDSSDTNYHDKMHSRGVIDLLQRLILLYNQCDEDLRNEIKLRLCRESKRVLFLVIGQGFKVSESIVTQNIEVIKKINLDFNFYVKDNPEHEIEIFDDILRQKYKSAIG